MVWLIGSLIALGIVFWMFGWKWERNFSRPGDPKSLPLVSILIPAYNSEKTIKKTLESAQNLDYPKKEIIVVNDSLDSTPDICKQFGAKCIQNKTRLGKAKALNKASRSAKGSILFFLDSDTTADEDSLKKLIPWFTKKKVAAVSPRYTVANKSTIWTRLAYLENSFISSLFKTHMFFGSLIAFRGCGVAIRKSVFSKVGGWPNTLIEDNDLAGILFERGYTIQYDHESVVRTREPETLASLKKQRMRWGKGFTYTFLRHRKTYFGNPQFSLYALPYLLLSFALIGTVFWQTSLFFIPLLSIYILYTLSVTQFIQILPLFFIPIFANVFSSLLPGSLGHVALMTIPEKKHDYKDLLLVIPYTFVYVPVVIFYYARGIISGIRDKKNKRDELDLSYW
jgi:peptidoglycan-N-acetylglucosamine deacetylase